MRRYRNAAGWDEDIQGEKALDQAWDEIGMDGCTGRPGCDHCLRIDVRAAEIVREWDQMEYEAETKQDEPEPPVVPDPDWR